jgi:hypothetical protein
MSLRAEFEPLMLSHYGLHCRVDLCREAWDREDRDCDTYYVDQIDHVTRWLSQCTKTRNINKDIGTSYGLKHIAQAWLGERGIDGYAYNGCFLMAAQRLGFKMVGMPARYCWNRGFIDETFNAYLNIAKSSIPRPSDPTWV